MISWLANFRLISGFEFALTIRFGALSFEIGPLLLSEHFPFFSHEDSLFRSILCAFQLFFVSTLLLFSRNSPRFVFLGPVLA